MRLSMWLLAAISLTGAAHAQSGSRPYYEYYVTAHNHFGETVYFSCNGGTPKEIHDDADRTINLHGPHEVDIECVATHDGEVIWSQTFTLSHHRPATRLVIQRHRDNESDQ